MKSYLINMSKPIAVFIIIIALAGSFILFTYIPEIPTDYEEIESDMADFDYCQALDDDAKFDCFEYFMIDTTDRDEHYEDVYRRHDMLNFWKILSMVIFDVFMLILLIAYTIDEDNRIVIFKYTNGDYDYSVENGERLNVRTYRREY